MRAGPFEVSVLAADSMGVRSLATLVDACGTLIGLDLGASIAPRRYGLPPHRRELEALSRARSAVAEAARKAEVIVVTHYHYDHYMRDEPEVYRGKRLFLKNPSSDVNRSQRWRARVFLEGMRVMRIAEVHYADGGSFDLGGPRIEFSRAVWHGEPGTPVGRVVMARISCGGESLIFASDVQGPADPGALGELESWRGARLLELSGPPTYFAGLKVPESAVDAGLAGLMHLIKSEVAETIIVDHHLLRDLNYRGYISGHEEEAARRGLRLVTAAEFMGRGVEQLEALRRRLWSEPGSGSVGFEADEEGERPAPTSRGQAALLDGSPEHGLRHRAYQPVHLPAVLEEYQGGYAHDLVPVGYVGVFVDVHAREDHPAREPLGQPDHYWLYQLAGIAPLGPEVHYHAVVAGDEAVEVVQAQLHRLAVDLLPRRRLGR